MPRNKKDLELIAEDFFNNEVNKLQNSFLSDIQNLQLELSPERTEYKEKVDRKILELAQNIAKAFDKKAKEEKFEHPYNEKIFILSYLLKKKKLLNDNPKALFLMCRTIGILDFQDLLVEIATAQNPDLLDRIIYEYVIATTRNISLQEITDKKEQYCSYVLMQARMLKTMQSDASDEEKYLALCNTEYEGNPKFIAKCFIAANFKNVEELIDSFLPRFTDAEKKIFLKNYEENFIPNEFRTTPYSNNSFIPIGHFGEVDSIDSVDTLDLDYYYSLQNQKDKRNQNNHAEILKKYEDYKRRHRKEPNVEEYDFIINYRNSERKKEDAERNAKEAESGFKDDHNLDSLPNHKPLNLKDSQKDSGVDLMVTNKKNISRPTAIKADKDSDLTKHLKDF